MKIAILAPPELSELDLAPLLPPGVTELIVAEGMPLEASVRACARKCRLLLRVYPARADQDAAYAQVLDAVARVVVVCALEQNVLAVPGVRAAFDRSIPIAIRLL